jgi:hypothetical protein
MQEKTMEQMLSKKLNNWLGTITDDKLRKRMRDGVVVTGGCFTSMIQNEAPNDYDCYFNTKELAYDVASYYVNVWNEEKKQIPKVMVLDGANPSREILEYYDIKDTLDSKAVMISNCSPERIKIIIPSSGVVGDLDDVNVNEEMGMSVENAIAELDEVDANKEIEKEKRPYFPVFISSNAITLSNGVQIVVRFYGEPDEIHETYDFVHTKAYFTFKSGVVVPREVYEAVINKVLKYTGSKYPLCSIFRMRKFIKRGWSINAGQILKMAMQLNDLDLKDINVLEDQLIGVDSIYFMRLIDMFRKQKDNNPDFELTPNYIVSIIDKIF